MLDATLTERKEQEMATTKELVRKLVLLDKAAQVEDEAELDLTYIAMGRLTEELEGRTDMTRDEYKAAQEIVDRWGL